MLGGMLLAQPVGVMPASWCAALPALLNQLLPVASGTAAPLPHRSGGLERPWAALLPSYSGQKAEQSLCILLAPAGYSNLMNMEGGFDAWRAAKYPVEK